MSNEIQNKTINLRQWEEGNEPPFNPEMEVEIRDFVGVFKKAYTKEWCDQAIKYFDEMTKMGLVDPYKKFQEHLDILKTHKILTPQDCIRKEIIF